MIDFFVPIVPMGKARPRVCKNGHSFTPEKTRNAEQEIRAYFIDNYPKFVALEGALEVQIRLIMPRPKSRKNDLYCLQKPDIDNAAKLVCDSLNCFAYQDDKQIVRLVVIKRFVEKEEQFGIDIRIIPYTSKG